MNRSEAIAAVAAALNDADRTLIGDPHEKQYHVEFRREDLKQALQLARQLALFKIVPSTTIVHDEFGFAVFARVIIRGKDEQRRLLHGFKDMLDEKPRRRLEVLTLARGPIPDEIVARMVNARGHGWSNAKIAAKMNEQGIIEGMGGVGWTARKVKKALAEYDKQHGPWSGAVEPGV